MTHTRTSRRWRIAGLTVVGTLALAACGSSKSGNTGDIAPVSQKPAAAQGISCQAAQVGPFTRCENFYKDYWPTIEKNLQKLYTQAQKTDGGRLVDWDWYQLSPDVIAQFHKKFPNIKVATRGLTYNVSSAIITAKQTGERNSDIVSGSITSMQAMYDQGYWEKIDWTKYGVPKEFLTAGGADTGLLPDSFNGYLLSYNSSKVDSVPSNLDDLTKPEWKGKLAINNYDAQFFTGYGLKNGKDKMVALIKKLKSSGNLTVVNDTSSLLSTGDKPVALGGQLFSANPDLNTGASSNEGGAKIDGPTTSSTKASEPLSSPLFVITGVEGLLTHLGTCTMRGLLERAGSRSVSIGLFALSAGAIGTSSSGTFGAIFEGRLAFLVGAVEASASEAFFDSRFTFTGETTEVPSPVVFIAADLLVFTLSYMSFIPSIKA